VMETGEPLSAHNARQKAKESPYNPRVFILSCPRETLYANINRRVDEMIANGLVEEVANLLAQGYSPDLISMQGLGYKEIVPVVSGEVPLAAATETLKQNTRRFAKRQVTWFKHQIRGEWVDAADFDDMSAICQMIIQR